MYASRMIKPTMSLAKCPGRVPFIESLLGCIQSYLTSEPDWVDVKAEVSVVRKVPESHWGLYNAELDEWELDESELD